MTNAIKKATVTMAEPVRLSRGGRPLGSTTPTVRTAIEDATAQAIDLVDWDAEELHHVSQAYRRLQRIVQLTQHTVIKAEAEAGIAALEAWAHGDRTENHNHTGVLGNLRAANGRLSS